MSKREPQIILKMDERSIVFELGRDGKFVVKSGGWDLFEVGFARDDLSGKIARPGGSRSPKVSLGRRCRRSRTTSVTRPTAWTLPTNSSVGVICSRSARTTPTARGPTVCCTVALYASQPPKLSRTRTAETWRTNREHTAAGVKPNGPHSLSPFEAKPAIR